MSEHARPGFFDEIKKCARISLIVSVPISVLFLLVGGALVHAGSVITIFVLFPGALLLTHQVVTGAAGIVLYLLVQLLW